MKILFRELVDLKPGNMGFADSACSATAAGKMPFGNKSLSLRVVNAVWTVICAGARGQGAGATPLAPIMLHETPRILIEDGAPHKSRGRLAGFRNLCFDRRPLGGAQRARSTGMTAGGDGFAAVAGGPALHIPVLGRPALDFLNVHDGGIYIDATFGAGGYSARHPWPPPTAKSSASTAIRTRSRSGSLWCKRRAAG